MSASPTYQWLTAKQHALHRPDTYAGGVTPQETKGYSFFVDEAGKVEKRDELATVSPALFKIFDEVVQNAMDNRNRDATQKYVKTTFAEDGSFSVSNDGRAIPIRLWNGTDRYVAEIIFGELMSGENFDDTESRMGVGGRNGLGVKITNLLSTHFEVEVVNLDTQLFTHCKELSPSEVKKRASVKLDVDPKSAVRKVNGVGILYSDSDDLGPDAAFVVGKCVYSNRGKLKYTQSFESNLSVIHPPQICKATAKDKTSSTTIRFTADLPRLGMSSPLDPSVLRMMRSRAFDIAACTPLSVHVDGEKVPFKSLKDYAVSMGGEWIGKDSVQQDCNGHPSSLEVCLLSGAECVSHVGFVNGIRCSLGTHMDHVLSKLRDCLNEMVAKKLKKASKITSAQVRDVLTVVVSARIAAPSFTTQTKEKLESRLDSVPTYSVSSSVARGMEKAGIVSHFCDLANEKEGKAVAKSVKAQRTSCIPKYERALKVGKQECNLYVTEGDSAKGLAVAGFSVIGRDCNGVFPLRGKLVNVHGMTAKKALEHKEIMHLTQILGLDPSVAYTAESASCLPYRHLVIFTDQDNDGSHIMGLLLNWLMAFYPTLLQAHPTFIKRFATPIVKARIGSETRSFFSQTEFQQWAGDRKPSSVKYYKGLGTSTNEEAKAYFRSIDDHLITVRFDGEQCRNAVDMWFSKTRSGERKTSLSGTDGTAFVDYAAEETSMREFCDKELVSFGLAANARSLASAIDGLKPSQRKALYATLVRKAGEVKVAQLAASAAELTAYHHGEQSMVQTIVAMAQPWMGANNVALLQPNGMFGSRHMPREEHSAPRYIFTERNGIARFLFPEADDAVLEMEEDDGKQVEPKLFAPVVAMLLVNGSEGIGTGWRNRCPAYSMRDILENTRLLVDDPDCELKKMTPSFFGFKGTTVMTDTDCTFTGTYEVEGKHVRVTELPPKMWTGPYVESLREKLTGDGKMVTDIDDVSTNDSVSVLIKMKPGTDMSKDWASELDLSKKMTLTDLNFWNAEGKLQTYSDVHSILRSHSVFRRKVYVLRREHLLYTLEHDLNIARSKARFVREVNGGKVVPRLHTEESLCSLLEEEGYFRHSNFDYLRRMGVFSMTVDVAEKLEETAKKLEEEVERMRSTTAEQMWHKDLDDLTSAYEYYEAEMMKKREDCGKKRSSTTKAGKAPKKQKK